MADTLNLKDFRISEDTAFLPEKQLKDYKGNEPWHEFANQLPKILISDSFAQEFKKLPSFQVKDNGRNFGEIDMRSLSYIAHAYLWKSAPIPDTLPAKLAEPWCGVAEVVGRPPVLSYASYCMHNFTRYDESKPPYLGNISIATNFLGGLDEDWFILVHVDIEARAAQAIAAVPGLLASAQEGIVEQVEKGLRQVGDGITAMNKTMERMPEACDPFIYYTRVRPYIFGSKNNPSLPDGLLYENCFDNKRQFFRGETGAQSSIIPTLDALLGVEHQNDPLKEYLMEMREYMVPEHRTFIQIVEETSTVRDIVTANVRNHELTSAYNRCIDQIFRFREIHLEYAANYIHKQGMRANNSTTIGTGGTPFMEYLAKHRDETRITSVGR